MTCFPLRKTPVSSLSAVLSALALFTLTPDVHAQFIDRLSVSAELGLGTMLSPYARDTLGFDGLGAEAAVHISVKLFGPLRFETGVSNWLFLRDTASNGRLLSVDFGLRARFGLTPRTALWVDLYAGPGFSGSFVLPSASVGLGFHFVVSSRVSIGPYARLARLFQTGDITAGALQGASDDAMFWDAGFELSLEAPERAPVRPGATAHTAPRADRDNDGVTDDLDQCVTLSQGDLPDPTRPGCPVGDTDNDGVIDTDDLCPSTPMGTTPNPDRRGCPDTDTDNDTLFDRVDQCPTEPMGAHPDPERPGCPRPETIMNFGEILFETDSAILVDNPQNQRTLHQALTVFSTHPEIELFAIEGHTDARDSHRRNLSLSRQRASAVRDWLAQHGIARERMVAAGYGERCPVDFGRGESALSHNRRVIFVVARRRAAPEAGASFGCPAAQDLVPQALLPPQAPGTADTQGTLENTSRAGSSPTHRRHRERQHRRHRDRRERSHTRHR